MYADTFPPAVVSVREHRYPFLDGERGCALLRPRPKMRASFDLHRSRLGLAHRFRFGILDCPPLPVGDVENLVHLVAGR